MRIVIATHRSVSWKANPLSTARATMYRRTWILNDHASDVHFDMKSTAQDVLWIDSLRHQYSGAVRLDAISSHAQNRSTASFSSILRSLNCNLRARMKEMSRQAMVHVYRNVYVESTYLDHESIEQDNVGRRDNNARVFVGIHFTRRSTRVSEHNRVQECRPEQARVASAGLGRGCASEGDSREEIICCRQEINNSLHLVSRCLALEARVADAVWVVESVR